ncbi:hypothetical protein GWO43_21175 [candidate division KSB1 bacterium]|nr:hypothetical protein [candidate division KSB1 bacterium]NIR72066.1 hypothetical protein [candidate division KSB1 bacterium]NIS26577.1 hypothetical protein [candidate division KSB1 bacterium]NIT73339.1 hypothetical protein [candidate division KSB1 bacterium]NIU27187.1 hypothetical protein [candidate division KSB1 bacterium]
MKKLLSISCIVFLVCSVFAADGKKESKAVQAFEKFKTLEGEWQAKGEDGKTKHLTYKVFAGGSAVQETFTVTKEGQKEEMVTMYHLDSDDLMLTHYCVANNQPRMRAISISDDLSEVAFKFVDATNLADLNDGHMYKAMFRFNDDGTFANAWTFRKDGEEVFKESDTYSRVD